jgi:hypothetical protein
VRDSRERGSEAWDSGGEGRAAEGETAKRETVEGGAAKECTSRV